MTTSPHIPNDRDALALIIQLRKALQLAATELHRRCVISSQINDALSAADLFIGYHQRPVQHHDGTEKYPPA